MKLGVVKAVRQSGKRVLLDALMDDGLYRDVVLVHTLHVRSRVGEGSRVFVGHIDGEDTTLIAWPIEFAGQVEDVGLRRDDSTAVFLRDGQVEVTSSKVSIADGGPAAPLATKADVDALTAAVNALIALHNAHAAATGLGAPATPASPAIGTLVLEAK